MSSLLVLVLVVVGSAGGGEWSHFLSVLTCKENEHQLACASSVGGRGCLPLGQSSCHCDVKSCFGGYQNDEFGNDRIPMLKEKSVNRTYLD